MTREELEQAVIRDIINGATHWVAPEAVALSVIRLVVEACISKSAFFLAAMPVLAPSSAPPSSQRTRAMAEISEKQARRICERLGIFPDCILPDVPHPGIGWRQHRYVDAPAWEIVQRAAAEAEEKKP